MVTSIEWQKIKLELKKNIEPIFKKAEIKYTKPFDEILDIFQAVLEKEIGIEELDDRVVVINALKVRYIDKDLENLKPTLVALSIKFESFIKRIFSPNLANETLSNPSNTVGPYLSAFWNRFKIEYSDNDFKNVTNDQINKFFEKDSKNNPINKPDIFENNSIPLGNHFKIQYDLANSIRHRDPYIPEDDLLKLISSVIACYLFITLKYSDRIEIKVIHEKDNNAISNWSIFKQYCNGFDKYQSYFLIADKLNLDKEQLLHFANIKWSFVFDLDSNSEEDGLFSIFKNSTHFPQVINQITHTSDDRGRVNATFPDNTTFWFYVQGNVGRQKSLVESKMIADWHLMYTRYTQDLMVAYYGQKYSFINKPIKVIILSKDKDRVKEIIYAIKGMNANLNITFIFVNDDNYEMKDLITEISGKSLDISTSSLLEGLREMENVMFASNSDKIFLPCHSSKGKSVEIPIEEANSIKQYFHLIHLNILQEQIEHATDKSFYQGRNITWKELDNHFDADRNITSDVIHAVKKSLEKRAESAIFYLKHYAGAGGTTVAKRVAFEIYRDFPVLFLNETISSYGETELTEKLLKVFQATELPSLVIIDNSNITKQQIQMLERVVGNRLAKTVFLLVESTFSEPKKENNSFYINSSLDVKNEATRFANKFSEHFKEKEKNFHFVLTENNPSIITPFYFGLLAYEKDYITIPQYVSKRLEEITSKEKDLLLLLAFCQIFGKGKMREVPHFIISKFLGVDEEYIRVKNHTLNHKIYDLIIETDDLCWRTIHPIIADRILRELIGTNEMDVLNPFELKDFAIKLIKTLRDISDNRNEQALELLHNIFILRSEDNYYTESEEADTDFSDNTYNKKLFSKLLNDLDNNNNRIEIFETLTSEFPDENAHFWAHFSRLYSVNKDFQNAIEKIDMALSIEEDFIFYHIKGMCYRTELYRLKDIYRNKKEEDKKSILEMKEYFNNSSDVFGIVRELVPQREHGYIAFIQMVIQMIEFEYSISPLKTATKDYTQFISSNSWCRNILGQATEAINDYKENNQEYESPKIREKQYQLLKFFGEKEKIINVWNGLLGNKEYDQNLVRRQLTYAYLAKNDFDWEKAKGKDIKRILELTEENLANKVDNRDLQLWFEVARQLNKDVDELIKKVEIWEFQNPSLNTAYFLMCLYGVQTIGGVKSGIDNYEKYQKKVSDRIKTTYSRVFCIEWVGLHENKIMLLNNKSVGKWDRDKQFFEEIGTSLFRLKGRVIKYNSAAQGFIEVENSGITVIYQPAKFNHYSDDAQKQTKVEFYVGFNYDGGRAFEVKNI
jgi:hypothetical protein